MFIDCLMAERKIGPLRFFYKSLNIWDSFMSFFLTIFLVNINAIDEVLINNSFYLEM